MRVFFVGNSYTLYNAVHQQVAALAEEAGQSMLVESELLGGSSLHGHYHRGGTLRALRDFSPTHVVLQEKSTGPIFAVKRFNEYVDRFVAVCKQIGASTVLYETWARHKHHHLYQWGFPWVGHAPTDMQGRITQQYAACAQRVEALVAPVGQAWANVLSQPSSVRLHDTDLHHASETGSHLASRVLFTTLTGKRSQPLRYRPKTVSLVSHHALCLAADSVCRRNALIEGD